MGRKQQSVQFINIKSWVRDLHAADAYYRIDYWLSVTIKDIAAAWVKLQL